MLSKTGTNAKIVALRYERNSDNQRVDNVSNDEKGKEIFIENLLWALNECEENDFSVDDRNAIANQDDDVVMTTMLSRQATSLRPVSTIQVRPATTRSAVASASRRKYVVHSKFPLLVNDYFHTFANAKLVRNLCLLQDYQVSFTHGKTDVFHSNLVKSYCKLLDSYDNFVQL